MLYFKQFTLTVKSTVMLHVAQIILFITSAISKYIQIQRYYLSNVAAVNDNSYLSL